MNMNISCNTSNFIPSTFHSQMNHREFEGSYGRVSQWAKRHDKSATVNYVAPDAEGLDQELRLVDAWFKRVRGYKA